MTTTTAAQLAHPLDPLSGEEIAAAVAAVRGAHDPQGRFRFVTVTLLEPGKSELAGWRQGDPFPRLAEIVALDAATEGAYEGVVDVAGGELVRWERLPDGVQPAIAVEEYELCEPLVREHPDFRGRAARARHPRGGLRPGRRSIRCRPATSTTPEERGRRLCRALAWIRPYPDGNSYARPIEGIVGLVDLHKGEVIRIDDNGIVPIPPGIGRVPRRRTSGRCATTSSRSRSSSRRGRASRSTATSIQLAEVVVPRRVHGARGARPAHRSAYDGRPILHRASFCEMAVPYGDPSPNRYIQGPFDIGENNIGTLANALELGCDCLGEIRYLDAVGRATRRASRSGCRTRSACTRRTSACSGSTGTSATATPRCAARAAS